MKPVEVTLRILAASFLVAMASAVVAQPTYPVKPIRLIIPYAPGGSTTGVARILGQKLTESWGQQVIIDNRGGGNTIIGSEALVRSPPDGYTMLLVASAHAINPNLFANLPYDTIKDFAPVATVYSSGFLFSIHPSLPANNLREFIALGKARPGELNFASSGIGSPDQLATVWFGMMAGIKMQHVPYKGSGLGITDLIGGQVQLYISPPLPAIPHVKTGRLRAIAYAGEGRLPALPQVPTFAEAGLPGFDMKIWFGILAPAGTPKEILDKVSTELGRILATPDMKEKLLGIGVDPLISTSAQFGALVSSEIARYGKIMKAANIKLQD